MKRVLQKESNNAIRDFVEWLIVTAERVGRRSFEKSQVLRFDWGSLCFVDLGTFSDFLVVDDRKIAHMLSLRAHLRNT